MFDSYDRFMLLLTHVTKICERTLLTHRLIHTSTVAFIIIKRRSNTVYKSINYGLSTLIYVSMKYSIYIYMYSLYENDNVNRTYYNIY